MQRWSRAEVTLDVMESQMERIRTRLSLSTSRDVLRSICDELSVMIRALAKGKNKVSSTISRRTQIETSCNEMQKILLSKEDGLPVSSESVEFDTCEFCLFSHSACPTNIRRSTSLQSAVRNHNSVGVKRPYLHELSFDHSHYGVA
jgi:hypothetical protein